jgi:hypothetical protein
LQSVWEKPVITFYRERFGKPEREAFLVVKARRLTISRNDGSNKIRCTLEDFFPLMGDIDYISSEEGKADSYVLCWFDDRYDDFGKAFRRLTGVTFSEGIKCVTDEKGKMSCNVNFEAKHGKLE